MSDFDPTQGYQPTGNQPPAGDPFGEQSTDPGTGAPSTGQYGGQENQPPAYDQTAAYSQVAPGQEQYPAGTYAQPTDQTGAYAGQQYDQYGRPIPGAPPEEPKSKKGMIWAIVVLAVIVLLVGIVLAFVLGRGSSPTTSSTPTTVSSPTPTKSPTPSQSTSASPSSTPSQSPTKSPTPSPTHSASPSSTGSPTSTSTP